MVRLFDAVETLLVADATLAKMISSLLLIALFLGIRFFVKRLIARQTDDLDTRLLWRQVVSYILIIAGGFLLAWIWFDGIGSVLAAFSLIAAALTIVNKELILNLTAWSVVVWRGLFAIGDRVDIGGQTGIVIDMGPLYVTLAQTLPESDKDQVTGRQVKVPNATVITQPVVNETGASHVTWNELRIALTKESDWRLAVDRVEAILKTETDRFSETADPGKIDILLDGGAYTPHVYVDVADGKVVLISRYACPTLQRRMSRSRVWQDVLSMIQSTESISLA